MQRASRPSVFVPFLVSLLALGAAPGAARAQSFDSVGVRAQGMGGAFVAVADDASATWWNPAGIAGGGYFDALVELGRTEEPRSDAQSGQPVPAWRAQPRGFAAAFPALGLSYYRLRLSEIQSPSTIADSSAGRQDQGTANLRLRALVLQQFGATVGQSIGEHLVVATTFKAVRGRAATEDVPATDASLDRADDLEGQAETHADLDIGAMARFGALRLGLTMRNVRRPTFGDGAERRQLDREARAGISITGPGRGLLGQLTLAVDSDLTRTATATGEERRLAAGAEAWLFGRRVGLRGGVSGSTVGEARRAFSGGLSLGLRSGFYVEGMLVGGGGDASRKGWGTDLRVTF